MLRRLLPLALIAVLAACGGGGTPSPSAAPSPKVGGLTSGLIAYATPQGVGVMDPASGKSAIVAPIPAGGYFRVAGPAWGTAPGLDHPVVYFTIHDDRPAESRESAGVVPYDWLFEVDPFTGTVSPVAAQQDSQSEGPLGVFANDHYLALTVGCCAYYEVDALDLTGPMAPLKTMLKPTDPVTFFTEGIAPGQSGLVAVRAFGSGAWYWLNIDQGALNPFPLKPGPNDGPIAITTDGSQAAVALPDRGATIEPISVAVPVATPSPVGSATAGASPSPSTAPKASASPSASAHASPTPPASPRPLNSRLPHPDSLAWSPDGNQVMVAVNGELELYTSPAPDGTAPVGRFFSGIGVSGVAWSGPIAGETFAAVKPSKGPQTFMDALLAATQLPAAADTPNNRPLTKIYVWQFDSSKPSPISSINDATPSVLDRYPPIAAGVVIHHWAPEASWAFAGGCMRYRVVITGSIAPVATTVGLDGTTLCSAPKPSPSASAGASPS